MKNQHTSYFYHGFFQLAVRVQQTFSASRDDEGMVDTGQVAFVPGHAAERSTEDLQRRAAPEDGPGAENSGWWSAGSLSSG